MFALTASQTFLLEGLTQRFRWYNTWMLPVTESWCRFPNLT